MVGGRRARGTEPGRDDDAAPPAANHLRGLSPGRFLLVDVGVAVHGEFIDQRRRQGQGRGRHVGRRAHRALRGTLQKAWDPPQLCALQRSLDQRSRRAQHADDNLPRGMLDAGGRRRRLGARRRDSGSRHVRFAAVDVLLVGLLDATKPESRRPQLPRLEEPGFHLARDLPGVLQRRLGSLGDGTGDPPSESSPRAPSSGCRS